MALKYDIKKDLRYLQGREEGEQLGEQKTKDAAIEKALRRGKLTIAEIAEDLEVSVAYVLEIKEKLNH